MQYVSLTKWFMSRRKDIYEISKKLFKINWIQYFVQETGFFYSSNDNNAVQAKKKKNSCSCLVILFESHSCTLSDRSRLENKKSIIITINMIMKHEEAARRPCPFLLSSLKFVLQWYGYVGFIKKLIELRSRGTGFCDLKSAKMKRNMNR